MSARTPYLPVPVDGHSVAWDLWDGSPGCRTDMRWENEGWTAQIDLVPDRVTVVLRLSARWALQQMLLFRDMDEPDLWLATDGNGNWGEMNGARVDELEGCTDIDVAGTPFTNSILIRRLPLEDGFSGAIPVAVFDVETLAVERWNVVYTRHDSRTWEYDSLRAGRRSVASVDDHGLVIDEEGVFRRVEG